MRHRDDDEDLVLIRPCGAEEGWFGAFHPKGQWLRATLGSFEAPSPQPGGERIDCDLSNGERASLYGCYSLGWRRRGPNGSSSTNLACAQCIRGADLWPPERPVRRARFELAPIAHYFTQTSAAAEIVDAGFDSELTQRKLFATETDELLVTLALSQTWTASRRTATDAIPTFEVHYREAATIDSFLEPLAAISQFFEASCGEPLQPSRIEISSLTSDEWAERAEAKEYVSDHSVDVDLEEVGVGRFARANWPIWSILGKESRENLEASLAVWIARWSEWADANLLLRQVMAARGELSGERLLTAARWVESIQTLPMTETFDADISKRLVDLVIGELSAEGADLPRERIAGAIHGLRKEPRSAYYLRLVDWCAGPLSAKERTLLAGDVSKAMNRRGGAAHGRLRITDENYVETRRQIAALEAVGLLLTTEALSLGENEIQKLLQHPLVLDYRLLIRGQKDS